MDRIKSLFFIVVVGCCVLCLGGCDLPILNPKGIIALQERNIILVALGLMMVVAIPTFIMIFVFVRRYRESNKDAKYDPSFTHCTAVEVVCWGIPLIIVTVLGIITWVTSHQLDPYRQLDSDIKPITVEVVALDWKWLFIYPEESIATVNFVQFPVNVPVNFKVTADAPMNSFWIPQLSGQIYAMAGMQTKLHIMATSEGDYRGSGASYSGAGFSGMKFVARVSSRSDYNQWVSQVKATKNVLTGGEYINLIKPSFNEPVKYYGIVRDKLYDDIIMKFMMPGVDIIKNHSDEMDMSHKGSM